ncbi:MAG TPA: zf-HC2 domain-containing protein [Candidatus Aminicenantes bacterium]|nr:zf-HC2 domain-containing protein [Candidatus Aminicenantes bacterium]
MTPCFRPEDLYLYLEGELGPYEAAKLEEHLEVCAACREALAERRLLHEAFTGLPPFEVPAGFARSVMAALPEPETVRPGWLAPLAAAVAALVIGLFGFYAFTGATLAEVLASIDRVCGAASARFLPFLAKAFKVSALLLDVAADAAAAVVAGAGAFVRAAGPPGVALVVVLAGGAVLLAFCGAKRLLSAGERS